VCGSGVKPAKPNGDEEQAEELAQTKREILKLRADMRRLEDECDVLKKAARYFAKEPG
jgi:transposase